MPAVISKFLESDQRRTFMNIPSSYVAGSLIATSLFYYVGYPLIENCLKSEKKGGKVTENNNSWHKNGVAKPPNPPKPPIPPTDLQGKPPKNGHLKELPSKSKVLALASKIPAFNLDFVFQFLKLLKIMIPSYVCRETVLLSGHTIFLLLRTFLSIYVASMEGAIVKYIVRKDAKNFAKMLLKWFTVALPATFINSMIRYLESRIALSFR